MKPLLILALWSWGASAQSTLPVPDYRLLPPKGNYVSQVRMMELKATCGKLHREFRRNRRHMPWICQHSDIDLPVAWHNYHYLRGLESRIDPHSCLSLCRTRRILLYSYYSYPTRGNKIVDSVNFCRCVGIPDGKPRRR